MDKIRITLILILTCVIIVETTCLAATGIVNAPSGLVLRETPSKDATPLTTIYDEEKVEIIAKEGEWYKVKYSIYEGYLFAEYVKVQEEQVEETKTEQETQNTEEPKSEEQVQETENAQEQKNGEIKIQSNYPQEVITNTNIKGYLIPSITSRVILDIEQNKTITINYEVGNWLNITYDGKQAWIRKYYMNIQDMEESVQEETTSPVETKPVEEKAIENKKGYVDVSSAAHVRKSASTSADIVTTLLRNAEVTITAESGDFYKIQYQNITGYIAKSLISDNPVSEEVTSRSNTEGERKLEQTQIQESVNVAEEVNTKVTPSGSSGAAIAEFAKQYVGYKYVYGGTTPSGFDCTGFAYYVYNSCGISLSRSCSVQASSGTEVARDNLQPGDLILFNNGGNGRIGHVGIYIGNGQIVHAENSRTGVRIDTINEGYYNKYYYSARRIAN